MESSAYAEYHSYQQARVKRQSLSHLFCQPLNANVELKCAALGNVGEAGSHGCLAC